MIRLRWLIGFWEDSGPRLVRVRWLHWPSQASASPETAFPPISAARRSGCLLPSISVLIMHMATVAGLAAFWLCFDRPAILSYISGDAC